MTSAAAAAAAAGGRRSKTPDPYPAALPAFLRQSHVEIANKFVDLEWQQRHRLATSTASPPSSSSSSSLSTTTTTTATEQTTQQDLHKYARLTGDHIVARNRYLNVEPFASNRVKLRVSPGENDYINASPIVLGDRRYIATQGPKDISTAHFYQMLAAEVSSPAVVVMLTQTHEAGREKCFSYFPQTRDVPLRLTADAVTAAKTTLKKKSAGARAGGGGGNESGAGQEDVEVEKTQAEGERRAEEAAATAKKQSTADAFQGTVTLLSTEQHLKSRTTIRRLILEQSTPTLATTTTTTAPRNNLEIYHCLFGGWPDFSIPEGEDRDAMIELIALSSRLNTASSAPSTSCFLPRTTTTTTDDCNGDDAVAGAASDQTSAPAPAPAPPTPNPNSNPNPRVVHCSAGVGRSGTFIALDYLFSQLEAGALDSVPDGRDVVAETVDLLRQQRMMMVQGEAQFVFLYDVLRDAWLQRWLSSSSSSSSSDQSRAGFGTF